MAPKLVIVITDSGIGGTEKAVLTLLKNLDRTVVEPVGIVVIKKKREMAKRWEEAGVPVYAIGMGRWPTPWGYAKLKATLNELNPDIVHAFLYHSIQLCRIASRNQKWQLMTSPRVNYKFATASTMLIDRLLRTKDERSLCESEAGKKSMVNLGYKSDALLVAPNGVEINNMAGDLRIKEAFRLEWGLKPGELVVGTLGRLHQQKGFDVLIEAAALLRSSKVPFRLFIAGRGLKQAELINLAEKLDVPLTMLGERPDPYNLLPAFDIYAQSSRYEGMSNALLEAMASGLPCVATAVDGTMDFAKDGENLILVKPNDPLSLSVGLGYLLEKPSMREKLSQNAMITAKEFSVDRMVKAFQSAYQAIHKKYS